MSEIPVFFGVARFLSNFYPSPIIIHSEEYPTVEHAFQAYKFTDKRCREIIQLAATPRKAKELGRRFTLRDDWETIKFRVMFHMLKEKFRQNEDLAIRLQNTGNSILIEGNTWHDNIWGNCTCFECRNIKGQNYLGRMLMEVRRRL